MLTNYCHLKQFSKVRTVNMLTQWSNSLNPNKNGCSKLVSSNLTAERLQESLKNKSFSTLFWLELIHIATDRTLPFCPLGPAIIGSFASIHISVKHLPFSCWNKATFITSQCRLLAMPKLMTHQCFHYQALWKGVSPFSHKSLWFV